MRLVFVLLSIVSLWGCGPLLKESGEKTKYFMLASPDCADNKTEFLNSKSVLIKDVTASAFVNSHKIIFRDTQYSLGHYQYAAWVESPPKQLVNLLVKRIECEKLFENVASRTSYVTSDYILSIEVLDFYHDITQSPNMIKIEIRAELADRNQRKILSKRHFKREITVKTQNIDGALESFNSGLSEILDEIIMWLQESTTP